MPPLGAEIEAPGRFGDDTRQVTTAGSEQEPPEPSSSDPIDRVRFTARLRLEPVALHHADDLWLLHQHPAVAEWHGGPWTREGARQRVELWSEGWRSGSIHKWVAYARESGELVGRGGASVQPVDGAERIEIGWTVRAELWGRGYATEIGRAALDLAFDELGVDEVVAFTEPSNARSRAVMERLAMSYRREIDIDGVAFVLYGLARRLSP